MSCTLEHRGWSITPIERVGRVCNFYDAELETPDGFVLTLGRDYQTPAAAIEAAKSRISRAEADNHSLPDRFVEVFDAHPERGAELMAAVLDPEPAPLPPPAPRVGFLGAIAAVAMSGLAIVGGLVAWVLLHCLAPLDWDCSAMYRAGLDEGEGEGE